MHSIGREKKKQVANFTRHRTGQVSFVCPVSFLYLQLLLLSLAKEPVRDGTHSILKPHSKHTTSLTLYFSLPLPLYLVIFYSTFKYTHKLVSVKVKDANVKIVTSSTINTAVAEAVAIAIAVVLVVNINFAPVKLTL